ncbi:MAG: TonB-dependent receptor domain-containing protein, partial [Gemmatimonadaceae bacterium]
PGSDHRIGAARVSIAGPVGNDSVRVHLGTGVRSFGANAFYGAYNSRERTGATTADASWTRRHAAWLLTLGASTRYHTDRFTLVRDHPAIYENLHQSWQTGAQVALRRTVAHGALSLAADATNHQLVSTRLGSRHEWREGAAAQVTWLTDAMTLDVGARADQSSTYGGFLSPAVALSVPVTPHLRLRTNASRGFRAPTWTERYYMDPANQGNAELAPEHFWSGEAGARIVGGANTIDIAVFARRAENLIDWVRPVCASASPPCTAPWKATNVGNANYAGVEGSIAFAPVRGVTYVLSVMSLNFTDHQGAQLVGKYALRPLTRQLSARASWLATARLTVGGEAMYARRSGESAFVTGTTHVSYAFAPQWDVTLDGTNLTNAAWLDASGMVAPGRAVFAGVRWGR